MVYSKDSLLKKNHSKLLTNFLFSIYEWRPELKEKFNLNTEKGELEFILWWIEWGKDNYPEVDISYGISSKFLNKHIYYSHKEEYDFRLPPLSECFFDSNLSDFNIDSYQFTNLLFQNYYINIFKYKNVFTKVLFENIIMWLDNNKERVEPDILENFFLNLKDKKIINEDLILEFKTIKHRDIKTDLIHRVENESYSGLITRFLYNVYLRRPELQDEFDITTEKGELSFILWWIKWGKTNYPDVSIDYGISKEFLNKHVYINSFNRVNKPPLYMIFSLIDELNEMKDNDLIDWICKFGYADIINSDPSSMFSKILNIQKNLYFKIKDECVITVIGKHKLDIGIGYDTKLIKKSFDLIGISSQFNENNNLTQYNIFTMPAPDALVELTQINEEELIYSTNILSCPWELPYWPESLEFLLDYFDYIWVHSNYVYKSIPNRYLFKVIKIPLPVEVHIPKKMDEINNDKFQVLTSFDLASTVTRKNPYGTIDAFTNAFSDNDNAELILKISNGDIHRNRLSSLKSYIENHNNIIIIDRHLKIEELHELYASINCFISLHRSEGFGRNIAEMMLLKKPVVVTNFSGNVDFTLENNSYLIPFEEINLDVNDYIFSKHQYWAEPNIEYASNVLLDIFKNGIDENKITNAYNLISKKYNLNASGEFMYKILKEYYEN